MKTLLALSLALLTQASFARIITGQEAADIREALVNDLQNKTLNCNKEMMLNTLKSIISRSDLTLAIDENMNQPVITITQKTDVNEYKGSITTSADFRSVIAYKVESYDIKDVRINNGTLVRPLFITQRIKTAAYMNSCSIK